MTDYFKKWFLEDVGIMWENHQWKAFNIGKPTANSSNNWSTGLGPVEIDDIFRLFGHSNLTFFLCRS